MLREIKTIVVVVVVVVVAMHVYLKNHSSKIKGLNKGYKSKDNDG